MDRVSLKSRAQVWLRDRTHLDRKIIFRVLTVAVFLSLAYVLFRNWREVRGYLGRMDYRYLCLALGVHAAALAATALGWHILVRQFTGRSGLRKDLKIFYSTVVAKEIPGVIWYIVGRAHLYAQEGVSASLVVTCSLMETVWFFVSGITVYLLLSPFYSRSVLAGKEALLVLSALPLIVLVVRLDMLVGLINMLLRRSKRQEISIIDRSSRWSLLTWLAYSAAWLVGSIALYSILLALHPLPLNELPTVTGFMVISGMVGLLTSMLPAGMGIRELTLSALLSQYMPFPLAVIVSLMLRTCVIADEMLWTAVALRL